MVKITKDAKAVGLGITVGISTPYLLKRLVDPAFPFPVANLAWSCVIPIVTGPIALILGYSNKVKKKDTKVFLKSYGFSTTLMGLFNLIDYYQIFGASQRARASAARLSSSCPSCTKYAPTKAISAVRYPYLYSPDTDIWSVKPAGYASMGYPYAHTTLSNKVILA